MIKYLFFFGRGRVEEEPERECVAVVVDDVAAMAIVDGGVHQPFVPSRNGGVWNASRVNQYAVLIVETFGYRIACVDSYGNGTAVGSRTLSSQAVKNVSYRFANGAV